MKLSFDAAAVRAHLDDLAATATGMSAAKDALSARIDVLGASWTGAAPLAHADAHETWSARSGDAHRRLQAHLRNARAAADRLEQAEDDATAIWL